jgi:hypothetical protein
MTMFSYLIYKADNLVLTSYVYSKNLLCCCLCCDRHVLPEYRSVSGDSLYKIRKKMLEVK